MYRALAVLLLLPTVSLADGEKEGKELLTKVIKAMGGEKELAKPHAFTGVGAGKLTLNAEQKISNRFTAQGLDSIRWETELTNADAKSITITLGLHEGKLWLSGNGGKANPMSKEFADAFRRGVVALRVAEEPTLLLAKGWKVSHLGELKADGKEMVGLKASRKGLSDIDLFFDKKTLLPARVEVRIKKVGASGEMTLRGKMSGYKKIDGRQFFTRLTILRDGKEVLEAERSELKAGDKADATTFTKP
jgi:hypothetical protein